MEPRACSSCSPRWSPNNVRFTDFLRTTVLISAAAASALAAVTVAGAAGIGDDLVVPVGAGWWVVAGLIGVWLGRRGATRSLPG